MRKPKFSDEKMVSILRKTDKEPVAVVAKLTCPVFSDQTLIERLPGLLHFTSCHTFACPGNGPGREVPHVSQRPGPLPSDGLQAGLLATYSSGVRLLSRECGRTSL